MDHTITPEQWLRIRDEYNAMHEDNDEPSSEVCPLHGKDCEAWS